VPEQLMGREPQGLLAGLGPFSTYTPTPPCLVSGPEKKSSEHVDFFDGRSGSGAGRSGAAISDRRQPVSSHTTSRDPFPFTPGLNVANVRNGAQLAPSFSQTITWPLRDRHQLASSP
jgi:hypothetical protein